MTLLAEKSTVLLLLCCVITLAHGQQQHKSTLNYTMDLLHNLLKHYDGRLRPVHNQRDLVIVNMHFTLDMLRDFDDVSGEITFLGTFTMKWKEERLQWDTTNYGGIGKMILPKEDVWNPELFMASSLNMLSHPGRAASKVTISSKGEARMNSIDLLTSYCTVDVTHYPNDYQTCRIQVRPTGYSKDEITFGNHTQTKANNTAENSEWEVMKVITSSAHGIFMIDIHLKRLSTYALLTMKIPIEVLGILNPWVFFLPPDSGERASYSITTFLAFTVYMGILTDNMPKGSMPMANLLYQTFIMLLYSVAILFCTIISLQIHTNAGKKPVPGKIQNIINCLSCSCLRNRKTTISSININTSEPNRPTPSPISLEMRTNGRRKSSLQSYSSKYFMQASPTRLNTKPETRRRPTLHRCTSGYFTQSKVYDNDQMIDDEIASHHETDEDMTWTHIGNVFDAYMLIFFGIWLMAVSGYYRV